MAALSGLSTGEARALEALMRIDAALSGRAIARVTGMTQSTAQRALTRLRQSGLVVAEPAPPSLLYRPNADHLAMPAIRALVNIEGELRERMADLVADWRIPAASLLVYGSVARGEATGRSDVDVLVVRPDATEPDDATWQHQLTELADRVRRWTGRPVSMVDMSQREVTHGLDAEEPFLVAAARDGWVIAGGRLDRLSGR